MSVDFIKEQQNYRGRCSAEYLAPLVDALHPSAREKRKKWLYMKLLVPRVHSVPYMCAEIYNGIDSVFSV